MLMADPPAALAETERVLRPGGRCGAAGPGPLGGQPVLRVDRRGPGRGWAHCASRSGRSIAVQHGDRSAHRRPAPGAGFADIRTEEVGVTFGCADVADYLDIVADTSGPMGLALQNAPDRTRADLAARLEPALARYATGAGHEPPGVAVCAVAASPL